MPSADDWEKIEEIKSRLDIVDVRGNDIGLYDKGNREYTGTVGETEGSGESLKVSKKQQVWKDFKNKIVENVLDQVGYYTEYTDLGRSDFSGVLWIAADLAGIELVYMIEEKRNAAKEKADIHSLFTDAAEIYQALNDRALTVYSAWLQFWYTGRRA